MLEYLRNAADKPLAKALMFVLIFSFVGWGVAEWIFGGAVRDNTLVRVGNAEISVQQYNNERSRQLASMGKEEQRATYTDPAKAAALTDSVMSKITMDQLALNRAKDLGLRVTEKRIAEEIRSSADFKVSDKFEPWMYDLIVQNSGASEKEIVESLSNKALSKMVIGITEKPVIVPQFAVDAAYNARYAKRDIKYTTVKFADIKAAEPTDEQLQTYYKQHPTIVPEKRAVSYVFLATKSDKPDVYDEDFKKAQQIEDMIISGSTMKEAAEKYKAKYVDVPAFARDEKVSDKILTKDLVAKVFSMDTDIESELLELKDGFAILRVNNIVEKHNADFKDVKKSLVNDWKKSEQRKKAYVDANEQLVNLKKNGSLKGAETVSVSRTEGAPLSVLNAAFAGKVGENSIVEDGDAFYVLHIDKSIAPKADKDKKANLRKELEKMSGKYASDDYSQFLKRHYPVKVNKKTFDRFIAK